MEALRCLKRRLSDVVYRQLVADSAHATEHVDADPGGHCGATLQSSAANSHPLIDTSDQPLPGPASPTLRRPLASRKTLTPAVP
jgi:transposase